MDLSLSYIYKWRDSLIWLVLNMFSFKYNCSFHVASVALSCLGDKHSVPSRQRILLITMVPIYILTDIIIVTHRNRRKTLTTEQNLSLPVTIWSTQADIIISLPPITEKPNIDSSVSTRMETSTSLPTLG